MPCPSGIATLNHEPVDHAVEDDAVVVRPFHLLVGLRVGPLLRALGEPDEVRHGQWRLVSNNSIVKLPSLVMNSA
jgi:hypothetical protein